MLALLLAVSALRPPISPLPAWFEEVPVEPSPATARPVDRLLVQRELRADTGQEIIRTVKRVNTLDGAEQVAQIQIEYDPEWQSFQMHRAQIRRAGRTIDALKSAEFRVLTREAGLERRILDGSREAVLILRDVRPGDVVEVAWSLVGIMPQLGGHFADQIYLGRDEPLGRLRVKMLVPAARHLQLSLRNGAPQPAIHERGGDREYLWDLKDLAPILQESDTPAWFSPYPIAELTDFASWSEVARWALSLVPSQLPLAASVERVIAPWRGLPEQERADAAMRFVREQIRYFGLENGIHAHRAHPPTTVLARRFGDCKDKALLLVTFLRALGVKADVALVNTSQRAALDERAPGPFAFNHAIVRATIRGEERWLDPTRSSERGSLAVLPRLPYARALVVNESTQGLSRLPDPSDADSLWLVEETWSARDRSGDGTLHVVTTWSGLVAEDRRDAISSQLTEQTERNSLAYYRQDEPAVETLKKPIFRDEPEANRFRTEEWLRIPRFWATGEHGFDAEVVRIDGPKDAQSRTQPLALRYPWHARQLTRIELPNRHWNLPDEVHRFQSAGFQGEVVEHLSQEPSGPVYLVTADLRTTADFVPPGEVGRYADALRDLRKASRVNLTLHGSAPPAATSSVSVWKGMGVLVAFLAVLGGALVGLTRAMDRLSTRRARSFRRKVEPLPGESAATPLKASVVTDVQRAARARRCRCGRSYGGTPLQPGESVRTADRIVHTVRLPCECGEVGVLYFVEV